MAETAQQPGFQDLSGLWIKDKEASESGDEVAELLELSTLLRLALRLMKGIDVTMTEDSIKVALVTELLGFTLRPEVLPLNGDKVTGSRRDRRPGLATAWVERGPTGGVKVCSRWDDPCGGTAQEHMFLHEPDLLFKDNTLTVSGQTVKFRAIFRRQQWYCLASRSEAGQS